jgi:hypothetical protein
MGADRNRLENDGSDHLSVLDGREVPLIGLALDIGIR